MNELIQQGLEIDRWCEEFESELKAGKQPTISRYVESASSAVREPLEIELSKILQAFRSAGGEISVSSGPKPASDAMRIGPYTLVDKIGEGGMGEVWLAQQDEPVRRKVALKLIKAGMDSKAVLARFEHERQALALLDHPNIARVLDAGMTPERRPYFVMELVKGQSLTKFCDDAKLGIPDRLAIFASICRAVQHAHNKGIVHRDLKPSNILVAAVDGKPNVKIIDFGVAKATGGKLTDDSISTHFGAVIGTLEYMAPEQAGMSMTLDLDTRADIYSLGVILYELLTGLRPFDSRRLQAVPLDELVRMIRVEEPPRPSARLLQDTWQPGMATSRRTELRSLALVLSTDLDWIVMKCLEKDRSRRYETANSLARDIERYLANEPIEARPPSAGYRLQKFVRRNRVPVLAGSFIVLALVGAIAGTSWGLVRANNAQTKLIAEGQEKDRARKEAQDKEAETASVLGYVDKHVFTAGRPKGRRGGLGKDVKLAEAVAAAAKDVEHSFPGQPLTEARLRSMLGTTLHNLGDFKAAEQQFAVARKLFETHRGSDDPDTLEAMTNLAITYRDQGRYKDALKLDELVSDRRTALLGLDHRLTLRSLHNLANSYAAMGRWEDALRLDKENYARRLATLGPDDADTIESMASLAASHSSLLQHDEALKLREKVLKWYQDRLGRDDARTIIAMNNLATTYNVVGRFEDSLKLCEDALALMQANVGPDHADTLMAMRNLAFFHGMQKRWPDALRLHRQVLDLRRAKLTSDHPDTIISMYHVADTLLSMGKGDEAIGQFDEVIRRADGKAVNPRLVPTVLERRIRYHAGRDDAAACRANAELWDKLTNNTGEFLAHAAQLWAITSKVQARATGPDAARLAGADADKAMAWLAKAAAAGYKNRADLEKNADFDALRSREDFQKLLQKLGAKD